MNELLEKPLYVQYTFACDCPWLHQKRELICRTKTEYDEIKHLAETQPGKYRIDVVRELPC